MPERAGPPPSWGVVVRGLVDALRTHRSDMHNSSSRPCSTCRKSADALALYEERQRYDAEQRASRHALSGEGVSSQPPASSHDPVGPDR